MKFDKIFSVALIVFILYSVIAMLLFDDKNHIFWISYLFTIICFIAQVTVSYYLFSNNQKSPLCVLFNKNQKSSTLTALLLDIFSSIYFFIQICISLIAMSISIVSSDIFILNVSIVIQAIVFGAFFIITILVFESKEYIKSVDEDTEKQRFFITEMTKKIEILSDSVDDDLKNDFNKLYETVRYSNPMSNEKVFSIEEDILKIFDKLKTEVNNNDKEDILTSIKQIETNFNARNVYLKNYTEIGNVEQNNLKEEEKKVEEDNLEPGPIKTDFFQNITSLKTYGKQISELKNQYQAKEKIALELIEKHFTPPQLTYNRFIGVIDNCNQIFYKQADLALNIINVATKHTPKIDEELKKRLSTLKSLIEKVDDLTTELLINLNNHGKNYYLNESKDLLDEMQKLIDSVKEYDY
jgi:hypothetical protein